MPLKSYAEIKFIAGEILTGEMLQETFDNPKKFLELNYAGFGEGILRGVDFFKDGGDIFLSAGIVKWRGVYYFLSENFNVSAFFRDKAAAGELVNGLYCCLYLSGGRQALNFEVCENSKLPRGILPLWRFSWYDLINLPALDWQEKNPFRQFVELVEAPFACLGGETFLPIIFRAVCEYLQKKSPKGLFDFIILAELQSHGVISLESIRTYIQAAGLFAPEIKSRADLFAAFAKALCSTPKEFLAEKSQAPAPAKPKNKSQLWE